MNLNKKDQTDLTQVYETWLQSYLNGDVKTYDYYLDEQYRFVGSTDNEEFLNRKDTTKFFEKTADQLAGKTDLKNTVRTIELIDGIAFITELFDAYFLIGKDWKFYGRFRFTSALSKKKEGWRFIYQHFSMPDAKAKEGETLGAEQISKENQELRDAIKRRTVELEQKNRDLEIEASLERVRSRAMAMQNSNELSELVDTVFQELTKLDFALTACIINIIDGDDKSNTVWATNPETGKDPESYFLKFENYKFHHGMWKAWKARKTKWVYTIEGEEKKMYDNYLFNETEFRRFSKKNKTAFRALDRYVASFTFSNFGGLQTIGDTPLSEESLDILARFGKVFDLTYTRFNDLKLAEAQAKEAQIETALERVRSRSMAMHKSAELLDTASELFHQLEELGIKPWRCGMAILNNDESKFEFWSETTTPKGRSVSINGTTSIVGQAHEHVKGALNAIKKKESFYNYDLSGKNLIDYITYITKDFNLPEASQNVTELPERLVYYCATFSRGVIYGAFLTTIENSDKQTLKRFAKVFDQTYTRFLDLQKAEGLARESEIELALERVRARTMAMQHSDELKEVILEVLKKLQDLGISMKHRATAILTFEDGNKNYEQWVASPEYKSIISLLTPYFDHPIQNDIWNARQNGTEFYAKSYTAEEKNSLFNYLFNLPALKGMPEEEKTKALQFKHYDISIAFKKNAAVLVVSHSGIPLSEVENTIIKKLAKVFDQTYTRFLDLQKAEAQARESEIELALERVRARTMAMQHSEELADVATVLFQQVKELGIPQWTCGFNIWETGDKEFTFYPGGPDGEILPSCKVPLMEHPIFRQFDESRKRGDELFIYEKEGEVQADHYRYMHALPGIGDMLQGMLDQGLEFPEYQIDHVANFLYGNIVFVTYEPFPEMHQVFIRFAKVFEQTYTRFLDLKKAEEQAREAEIELALERVRSRSMAMHKSEELKAVIQLVYEQFVHLNIQIEHTGFIIDYKEQDDMHIWLADKHEIPTEVTLPYFDCAHWNSFNEAKAKDLSLFTNLLDFKEKNKFYHDLFEFVSGLPDEVKEYYLNCPGLAISTVLLDNIGLYIENFKGIPYTDKENDTLMRFGKVFQQTYTRFLDLQKAEEQAKEAQIEASLERVRSKTMAMHNSKDVEATVITLFEEILKLDVDESIRCGIGILSKSEDMELWTASFGAKNKVSVDYGKLNMKLHPLLTGVKKAWKDKNEKFSYNLVGKEVINYFKVLNTTRDYSFHTDLKSLPNEIFHNSFIFSEGVLYVFTTNPLPVKTQQVLSRFTGVFEQTYTRFLDLQKAEAQAREAQIEMALEKVRSRTMAMQKGEEVKDVVVLLYKELLTLGVTNFATCGYVEINEETKKQETWVTSLGGDSLGLFYLPLTGDVHFDARYEAWKKQQTVFHQTVTGKERKKHLEYAITTFNSKEAEEMVLNQFPDPTVFYCFNFSHGYLHLVAGSELNKEEESLLARFTRVFEQTYARFLDLQKAEAQAREAQIETALERVRSRSMAMHKSDELKEVVKVIFDQMTHLKINADHAGIVVDYEPKKDFSFWVADNQDIPAKITVPYLDLPWDRQFTEAKKKGKDFFTTQLDFEEKNNFYKKLLPHIEGLTEQARDFYLNCPGLTASTVIQKDIGLYIENFSGIPFSDEENSILMRFGKVFQQTYTRFLDLQKAESQAREAQIEAALERVRSRSLAMHKPEELQEVVAVVAEKLNELGVIFDAGGVILCTYFPDNKDVVHWITVEDFSTSGRYFVPYFDNPIFNDAWDSKIKGDAFFSKEFPVEAKNDFFNQAFENSDYKQMPKNYKQHVLQADKHHLSAAWSKNSAIIIPSLTGAIPSKSDAEIMKRFAKVFEQAYIRFLDLQNAESQAREAQIEASLERTRTQSMLMQHSDELNATAKVFHQQLQLLGIDSEFSYLWLPDEAEKNHMFWATWSETKKGKTIFNNKTVSFPLDKKESSIAACYVAWESEETVHVNTVKPNEVENYFATWAELLNGVKKFKPKLFPDGLYYVDAYMKYGCFGIMVKRLLTDDEKNILSRFTKEFERTYSRFLGLQKAEAQTREAQIENALEKVRSRTMAMQHSDELPEAANVLFLEVQALGIPAWSAGYCIWENEQKSAWCNMSSEGEIQKGFSLPTIGEGYNFDKPFKNGESFYVDELGGEKLVKHYEFMKKLPIVGEILKEFQEKGIPLPTFQIFHIVYFTHGYLMFITYEAVPNDWDVFKRFGKVFEQTYTRFLDLQKAEEQAKEARIEVALEKVRSKTMAMHESNQLNEVIGTVFEQLQQFDMLLDGAQINIFDGSKDLNLWVSIPEKTYAELIHIPYFEHRYLKEFWKKKQKGEIFITHISDRKEKDALFKHLFKHSDLKTIPISRKKFILDSKGWATSTTVIKNASLIMYNFAAIPYSDLENEILKRFSKVFEQTYTRFLDLQKAEAQTRQAQINLAVERVRAKALAMHKSEEIMEVVAKLKEEVMNLDIPDVVAATIFLKEGDDQVRMWDLSTLEKNDNGYEVPFDITFKLRKTDPHLYVKRVWENQENYFVETQAKKDFKRLMAWLREHDKVQIANEVEEFIKNTQLKKLYHAAKKLNNGKLCVDLLSPPTEEMETILTKMGGAFDLAYKRFEDLQKAEAQTREAQIEAALERVRSKTMAMQQSEELQDTSMLLFQQVEELGINSFACGFNIWDDDKKFATAWMASKDRLQPPFKTNSSEDVYVLFHEAEKRGVSLFILEQKGKKLEEHYKYLVTIPEVKKLSEAGLSFPTFQIVHCAYFSKGYLMFITLEPVPEAHDIFKRFAKVFEQTYTRFLDLQKAEAQARESEIELALERVRSRTMAMHKSNELLKVIKVISEQLIHLNIRFDSVSFGKNNQKHDYHFWMSLFGYPEPMQMKVPFIDHPVFNSLIEAYENHTPFLTNIFSPEENKIWLKHVIDHGNLTFLPNTVIAKIFNSNFIRSSAILKNTQLFVTRYASKPFAEYENKIIARFAQVFEQSYTRFLDLQKAEVQAKEAVKQSSLDRVRAEIASMRNADDLNRITPLVWKELTTLGVPFFRCGVFIVDNEIRRVHAYLSTPSGESLAALELEFDSLPLVKGVVSNWKQKKVYVEKWNKEQFIEFTKPLIEQGQINSNENYQGGLEAPEQLVLQMVPFKQGMLYVGSEDSLTNDHIAMVESLAMAFSIAYTRYEDFKELEAAKVRAEDTLSELKSTQTQLIQSEKMASLGELTAGIAHEIQNPLNFVNNFSELSEEMVEELAEEIKDNSDEIVIEIMTDLKQNLNKITNHGKRASSIVKGMLEHSRTGSGEKAKTDINKLADEFLRLSYHGLRAKDKSFNADFKIDFDTSLPKVNVIAQDLGRVILNLINNAFYACAERSRNTSDKNYKPKVTVSTKTLKSPSGELGVEIRVKDNGSGIPENIKDKIFQPFFTTKPTGSGTGLGLSLAYDIIAKGHGGEMKVETKQGESLPADEVGTEFIIQIPIKK